MRRRKPFLLAGNFQLGWLVTLTLVAGVGVLAAARLNYYAVAAIFEEAVFSAHLSTASSGDLVWRAICEITLLSLGASALIGCTVIIAVQWYLERFFHAFALGLEKLAQGDRAYRFRVGFIGAVNPLIRGFNKTAEAMDQQHRAKHALLEAGMAATDGNQPKPLEQLRALHSQMRLLAEAD
jgi:methyl-accepting chemotaxis protein